MFFSNVGDKGSKYPVFFSRFPLRVFAEDINLKL